jgi:hypothetical protein
MDELAWSQGDQDELAWNQLGVHTEAVRGFK